MSHTAATSKGLIFIAKRSVDAAESFVGIYGDGDAKRGEQNNYSTRTQSNPEAAVSREWDIKWEEAWKAEFAQL